MTDPTSIFPERSALYDALAAAVAAYAEATGELSYVAATLGSEMLGARADCLYVRARRDAAEAACATTI